MKSKLVVLFLVLLLFSRSGFGENTVADSSHSYVVLPILFYGDETSWGFGASGGYYINSRYNKTSSLQANAIVTLNKQASVSVVPYLYTKSGDFFYSGYLKYNYYPNKFFGIGRNTADSLEEGYTSKDFSILLQQQRMMFGRFMIGAQYSFGYYDVADIETDGIIATNICGSREFLMSGLGALLTWDNRSNRFWPTSGTFFKASVIAYSNIFGSDLTFTQLNIDLRKFVTIHRSMIFAMQILGNFSWNEVPFQLMPKLGGADVMRGYYNGRYRDKMMLCAQAEFRFDIYRWIRGVAFASIGDVAPQVPDFNLLHPKYSYGCGIRARVSDSRVNIRADIALNDKFEPSAYLTVVEAF